MMGLMKPRVGWLLLVLIAVLCLGARRQTVDLARHVYVEVYRLASPGGGAGVTEAGQSVYLLDERQTTPGLWFGAVQAPHRPHRAARMTWAGMTNLTSSAR